MFGIKHGLLKLNHHIISKIRNSKTKFQNIRNYRPNLLDAKYHKHQSCKCPQVRKLIQQIDKFSTKLYNIKVNKVKLTDCLSWSFHGLAISLHSMQNHKFSSQQLRRFAALDCLLNTSTALLQLKTNNSPKGAKVFNDYSIETNGLVKVHF